jgi:hypothetical protein
MYPNFQTYSEADSCLPRVSDGPKFVQAKATLLMRAKEIGYERDAMDDLHIIADGRRIEPSHLGASRVAFLLPAECSAITLRSRSFVPAHSIAESTDGRLLGVCLNRLQLDGDELALPDDAVCTAGWQEYEDELGGRGRRWTTGSTPLPANTRLVVADVVGRGTYWSRQLSNVTMLWA